MGSAWGVMISSIMCCWIHTLQQESTGAWYNYSTGGLDLCTRLLDSLITCWFLTHWASNWLHYCNLLLLSSADLWVHSSSRCASSFYLWSAVQQVWNAFDWVWSASLFHLIFSYHSSLCSSHVGFHWYLWWEAREPITLEEVCLHAEPLET